VATNPGTQSGDVVIALFYSDSTIPSQTSSGWTSAGTAVTTNYNLGAFWRVAGASEPASWAMPGGAGSTSIIGTIVVTGANTSAPIGAFATSSGAATTAQSAPSVTPTVANSLLINCFAQKSASATHSTVASATEAFDVQEGSEMSMAADYQLVAATTATGTKSSTASASAAYDSLSLAISPATTSTGSGTFTGTGSGTLTASGVPAPGAGLSLSGSGTLTSAGSPRPTGSVNLSGSGTLTLTPARTFYVSPTGSDAADGLSSSSPWATLAKVQATTLAAGDSVLFARGGTWTQASTATNMLSVSASGNASARITLGAYGSGAAPILDGATKVTNCIAVSGNYVTVADLTVRNAAVLGTGGASGVFVTGTDSIVQRVEASGCYVGVTLYDGAHRGKILSCNLHDNTRLYIGPGAADDAFANGIGVWAADSVELASNTISGHVATSPDFGVDGAAIEIYGATNALIHHNVATDNQTFTELGRAGTANNTYHDNLVTSAQNQRYALTIQGTDGEGPVYGTRWINNTVVLTGATGCEGYYVGAGVDLYLHNNIWVVSYIGEHGAGSTIDEGHSVYVGDTSGVSVAATSTAAANLAAVKFVNAAGGNYRLAPGSPAIDRGTSVAYTTDLDGNARTAGTSPDAGAYEFGSGSNLFGTLALSGSGGLALSGVPALTATLALSGSGALTLIPAEAYADTLALTGSGVLAVSGAPDMPVAEHTFLLTTPSQTVYTRLAGRGLFASTEWALTLWRIDGQWFSGRNPTADQVAAADRFYGGGRIHHVSADEAAELSDAGFGSCIDLPYASVGSAPLGASRVA
jgi:hypothetical protein